jgi:purine-cytosine permease-like protein
VESGDISGFVVGMQLGLAALVILLLLQTDEVFANVHSAGVALGSLLPAGRWAGPLVPGLAVLALALPLDFLEFEATLLLLASLFVPLFGVLMADFLQSRGGTQRAAAPSALTAWALGFLLYHWISPTEVGWWQDAMSWLFADALHLPFPLTDEVTWLGAAIPSFLAGFAVHLIGKPALIGLRPAWGGSRP